MDGMEKSVCKTQEKNDRESHYDLMRALLCIGVIIRHISAGYIDFYRANNIEVSFADIVMVNSCLLIVLAAVPCFIMLSGAFLIDDNRNADFAYFYHSKFKKFGITTLVFSVLYVLFQLIKIWIKGESLRLPFIDWLRGEPYYHMWYMYLMLGLYILIPVLVLIRQKITRGQYLCAGIVYLVMAIVSAWTSTFSLMWSVTRVSCYVPFLMLGYSIRKAGQCCGSRKKVVIGSFCSVVILSIFMICVRIYTEMNGNLESSDLLIDNFSILPVVSTVLYMLIFSNIRIKRLPRILNFIAKNSFYIYLFHAGILDIVNNIFEINGLLVHQFYLYGSIRLLLVLLFSCIAAVFYRKIDANIRVFLRRRYHEQID